MVKRFFVVVEFEILFCYFPKKYFLIFSMTIYSEREKVCICHFLVYFRLKMKWT